MTHLPLPLPRMARARRDHPALVWRGKVIPYRDLAARADRLARQLAGLGVGAGDRVALLLPNRPLLVALVHAAARLEAIVVPLNTRLTADEIAWQVENTTPGVLVYDSGLRAKLAEVGPSVRMVCADGALSALPPADIALADRVALDAPQAVIHTSGTTGRPKGAVLTHGNQLWSATGSALRLGVMPDDRWLVPLPLFHVGGLAVLLRSALYGTTVVLAARFDADEVAAALRDGRATLVSLVPTMLARVLDAWPGGRVAEGVRAALLGGGPIPEALIERAAAVSLPLAPTYGLTEAASQVATAWPSRTPARAVPPLAFTELRVADEDGRPLPVGSEGQIHVRGPTVTPGYWNDPDATVEVVVDGWLHTGDIGRLDADGRLHVSGRRDDLIVSGGENVYPAEVEAALLEHPAVRACSVVGVPDPEWGQQVAAAVVTVADTNVDNDVETNLDIEALERHLRGRLAGYKVPRRWLWLEALPRTASGKVQRAEVRRLLGVKGVGR